MKKHTFLRLIIVFFLILGCNTILEAGSSGRPDKLIGPQDGVILTDAGGKVIFSKNAHIRRMPASTLKILTALIARHYLGSDFCFVTEFYLDKENNLIIKGFGDPLLISEVLPGIARSVHAKTEIFHDLIVDDSWFERVTIPGVTSTLNPYDSPNGALCVNFNTVNFRRVNGAYVSAEAQTPLLPFVSERVRKSGLRQERIVLSSENNETLLYAGHMFRYFLEKEGIRTDGSIRTGKVRPGEDRLIYRHLSQFSLDDVIMRLMEYSNNFIANQLLIRAGTEVFGPPGNLEKARKTAALYCKDILGTDEIKMDEGSGISRNNRISPLQMLKALDKFEPYRHLLRHEGREYYKTGSLTGVKARAGFIEGRKGLYRFAVMLNSPGKTTAPVMREILRMAE